MKQSLIRRLLLLPTLALTALASGSFLEAYVFSGHKWGVTTVPYYVNARNKWVSEAAAVSAIQSAAAGWHEQSRANIQLAYAGQTSGTSVGMNYKSEVFFRGGTTGGNVAEGYAWWDGSGKYVDGDIVFFEDAYRFFVGSGCANGVYIENVGMHEFGHVLGLNHSSVADVTMQPRMQSYCDRTQLSLEADDIAGIEALYPPLSGAAPANTAPAVSIASPGNNASYADGETITFSGSATDTQEGNLSSRLKWTSNLTGFFGTGGNLSRALPAGVHLITASASDSGGLVGADQATVTITVEAQEPAPVLLGARLEARGYKVKGQQKVDLNWSGLSSASVDLYRNGAKIQTIANDGTATDPINRKGGGSYTYKVCEAGSGTCSNNANVSF